MTKKENIKHLYGKIKNKSNFIQLVADETGRRFGSVKTHWLSPSGGFSVPELHQGLVIKLAQNTIKNQKNGK